MKVVKYVVSGRPVLGFDQKNNEAIKKQLEIQGIPNTPIKSIFKLKITFYRQHNDFYRIGKLADKAYDLLADVGIVRDLQSNTIRRSEYITIDDDADRRTEIVMWVDENNDNNKGIAMGLLPILDEFTSDSFHPPKKLPSFKRAI